MNNCSTRPTPPMMYLHFLVARRRKQFVPASYQLPMGTPPELALNSLYSTWSIGSGEWMTVVQLQVIFGKRAINYRAYLRKVSYENKAPYASSYRVGWMNHCRTCRPRMHKLQVIFRKRAMNCRALLREMTYKDEASYEVGRMNDCRTCRSRMQTLHCGWTHVQENVKACSTNATRIQSYKNQWYNIFTSWKKKCTQILYSYVVPQFCESLIGYGVATCSRLLEIIRLFCKRALWKRQFSAKETYNLKEPTNRSHHKALNHNMGWLRSVGSVKL